MASQVEVRPRRLIPRYPLSQSVTVRNGNAPARCYTARDVSEGGLFLATEDTFEIFSDIELEVALPGGRCTTLPARVVHILSPEKAKGFGTLAGVGLQFENLNEAQRAHVRELVAAARAEDPRPRIARPKHDADLSSMSTEPMLSYLLQQVDGRRDPEALAESLSLDVATVERMLQELLKLGAIELTAAAQLTMPPQSASAHAPAATPQLAARPRAPQPAVDPATATAIDPELVALLTSFEAIAPDASYYAVLSVQASASVEQIRSAFQAHEASLPARASAGAAQRIEKIRARLLEAYGVLSSSAKRHEYDEYLDRKLQLSAAEAARAALRSAQVEEPAAPARMSALALEPVAARGAQPARMPSAQRPAAHTAALRKPAAPGPAASTDSPLGAAARVLEQAELAFGNGLNGEAVRHLKLLSAMTFADPRVQARATALRVKLARALAVDFEKQAAYEEKRQHWAQAAQSWLRVSEGRPTDSLPLQRAALALLQAQGDLRQAMEIAKRAVELADTDPNAHRVLARIYLAADMKANARRELEAAERCSPQRPAPNPEPSATKPSALLRRMLGNRSDPT